ncbi:MAG TPA: dephospho-CoA kinase [Acidisarcina sp.]
MLRVGLTGGLGSGKSTAARLFAALGVHTIAADEIGRELMEPGQPVYAEIVRRFGGGVVLPYGNLDRSALADAAFRDGRLRELNEIVHPPVIAAQQQWMDSIFAEDAGAIAMVESALIFEVDQAQANADGADRAELRGREDGASRWRSRFHRIVLITAAEEQKVERYVARTLKGREAGKAEYHAVEDAARMRLRAQISDAEKHALSDYVINNGGTLQHLEESVKDVYTRLRAEADALIK